MSLFWFDSSSEDLAWQKRVAEGHMRTPADLRQAVLAGAVRRIRPKFMTVATMFLGLVPILWSTGADLIPMELIVYPPRDCPIRVLCGADPLVRGRPPGRPPAL